MLFAERSVEQGVTVFHPDVVQQAAQINGLKRVEGQVRSAIRMIEDHQLDIDVLNQLKAAQVALRTIERQILSEHVRTHIKNAVQSPSEESLNQKIGELLHLLERFPT
ncbi:MAG: metal-sensitive transcriptional regulator [Acidobacteria bacterium]|nr:metal-sensitive transcriptional regulator [Acidobacteriota bacterium]